MNKARVFTILVCLVAAANISVADIFGTGANQFTLHFVTISDSSNPTSGYGIVPNDYRIGKYEITNTQWTKFKALNGPVTGTPSSAYDANPYFTGPYVPTNRVSWFEAAQFVNYLNTSTGHTPAYKFTGTKGTSNYTMVAWDAANAWSTTNVIRNKNAYYFLPSEDEWVKAAYWNGTAIQSDATKPGSTRYKGNGTNGGWNFWSGGYATNPIGPWAVGSGSEELNGTYDMMGNVWEWMESPYLKSENYPGSIPTLRGGGYDIQEVFGLNSSDRYCHYAYSEYEWIGFRVASIPEPATLLLLGMGGFLLRRKK